LSRRSHLHNGRDKARRPVPFKQHIGKGLEDGIGDKEDGKASVVLLRGDVHSFCEAGNLCVADVGSVKEGQEVKKAEL
jgi:hypothetical protein